VSDKGTHYNQAPMGSDFCHAVDSG